MNLDRRQPASRFCFVCGKDNPQGLQLDFYQNETTVWTEFIPQEHHQSWPGMVHGGILTSVLDETTARVAFLYGKWAQTGKLEVRFRKPAPIGEPLRVEAMLEQDTGRAMKIRGSIRGSLTGDVLAEASGLFMPIPERQQQDLMTTLGDEFAAWKAWLSQTS